MRADKEQRRRANYAKHLAEKRAREGYTFDEAYDKMYERNYFGMAMVESGDADTMITGLYTKYSDTIKIAKDVIGIRPEYKHFGTMHILNTKRGIYYIADTLINRMPNAEALVDITRLAHHSVKFFNDDPVMAMVSFSNFGSDEGGSPQQVREALAITQETHPDWLIDGEMQNKLRIRQEVARREISFHTLKRQKCKHAYFP